MNQYNAYKRLAAIIITGLLSSCNWTSKDQNLRQLYGASFCLDVQQTAAFNKIKIGNGKLTLNRDRTFTVVNDSVKYSNISGKWDVCCYYNYDNYIFKVKGFKEYKTDLPEFYVQVDGKEIKLVFTGCR